MKTIGLLGGMSWESTLEYYRIINETVKKRLGGYHSAQIIINSIDFAEIEKLQHEGNWTRLTELMIEHSLRLQSAGSDFLMIGTNTMHLLADEVENSVHIPLLHIADATAKEIKKFNLKKVGLLGTRFTMEKDFYSKRLADRHQIEVIIPSDPEREKVHRVIYDELVRGITLEASRNTFLEIIDTLVKHGAEGIILGCTEIPNLIREGDTDIPLLNTTKIHAEQAVDWSLGTN